jgi:hypothetical protein
MIILIPLKPAVLVLGLLNGLIFVGFVGSCLLGGNEPFVMDRAQTRHALVRQDTARATLEHMHPQKPPPRRVH